VIAPADNGEAIEAWNTVLFDKFVKYRDAIIPGLKRHGDRGLARLAPHAGARVVDLGCGFGDTTVQLAELVGPTGHATGLDAAARFIATAAAENTGTANARFEVADVESAVPGGPYDLAFSRMGMMFFASPVRALRNVYRALVPGGRLCMVVWRSKGANEALTIAEDLVRAHVGEPDRAGQVTCGPGPFSMASADACSEQLRAAGFTEIAFERHDADMWLGASVDQAIEAALDLGPAGELVRLAGAAGIASRAEIIAALRPVLARGARADGVYLPSSTWIVTATRSRSGN
jgi:ubiquinone/menaquinone biosynthesis C-methylase UbiE